MHVDMYNKFLYSRIVGIYSHSSVVLTIEWFGIIHREVLAFHVQVFWKYNLTQLLGNQAYNWS